MLASIDAFRAVLEDAGLLPGEIVADGKLHRCPTVAKPKGCNGWYIFHSDPPASGAYGDWGSSVSGKWTAKEERLMSPAEKMAFKERIEADRRQREQDDAKRYAEAAVDAQRLLTQSIDCTDHPYLTKKGVKPCLGLKVSQTGSLTVPVHGEDGYVMSIQGIDPDGGKRFLTGGRTKGGYFPIPGNPGRIYIVEGLATGLSVSEASGQEVLVAFNCGNLEPVAKWVRSFDLDREIVLCADDDHDRADGKNPGLYHATAAASAIGGLLAVPSFKEPAGKTDFNDLHQAEGINGVKELLEQAAPPSEETESQTDDDGSRDTSPQWRAALRALDAIGAGNVVHAKGYFWRWRKSGVWSCVEDMEIKQVIQRGERDNKKLSGQFVNSVMSLVQNETHRSDHDFDRDPATINVLNGELRWDGSVWELNVHKRENFRTTQIPVNYTPGSTAPRFIQFLDEVFRDDSDKEEKKCIVLEAIGYSLMSSCEFEKFIMLIGAGANGKSVLMEVLKALVGFANTAAVQPSQFENRFQRAHLHGKLVNLVTEIAEGAEIADAQLKSIVSGETTTAEHKMKTPFEFNPICTCWFGTNHLPHTRDFSAALFRRAIVIPFNRTFTDAEQDKSLKAKLCKELPGIMNMALEAFSGVLTRGCFSTAVSCESIKQNWRLESDQVAQFVGDRCLREADFRETTDTLYQCYKAWAEDAGIKRCVNKNNFSTRMERLGADHHRTGRARYLVGFKLRSANDASDTGDAVLEIDQNRISYANSPVSVGEIDQSNVENRVTCVTRVTPVAELSRQTEMGQPLLTAPLHQRSDLASPAHNTMAAN